jgi:hypothetical protein
MAKPQAGPPQPGDVYRALRGRSPLPDTRDHVPPGDPARIAWPAALPAGQAEAIEALQLERTPIDPGAIVIYATAPPENKHLYLHRIASAFPGDSGWYIGPADTTIPPALETARADEMQKLWPDLATFLQLPPGTLIVVDSAGIAAVLDANDKNLWK